MLSLRRLGLDDASRFGSVVIFTPVGAPKSSPPAVVVLVVVAFLAEEGAPTELTSATAAVAEGSRTPRDAGIVQPLANWPSRWHLEAPAHAGSSHLHMTLLRLEAAGGGYALQMRATRPISRNILFLSVFGDFYWPGGGRQ